MRNLKYTLVGMLLLAVVFGQTEKADLIAKVDDLNEAKEFNSALKLLQANESNYSEDADFLWRIARAYFAIADQNKGNKQIEKDNFYPGFERVKKCVEINPNLAEGHQYYAILVGKIGELEGTKQKITNSYQVKEHAMKAIELDPENDKNYHIMGRWNYALSELSWVEKKVAELIYSKLPDASFDEAVKFFKKAHQISPKNLRHILWLGKSLEELGKKDDARNIWKEALAITPKSEADKNIKNEIKKALK